MAGTVGGKGDPTTVLNHGVKTHVRHNHDTRRYGGGSDTTDYSQNTGTDKTSESVTIPASLIEQQQAAESDNQEYPVVQEVTPPRPLGL